MRARVGGERPHRPRRGLLAFTAALTLISFLEATAENNLSVTGAVAGILTFTLGAYAMLGKETVAVAAAAAMAILLAMREPLHSWVRSLTWVEMRRVLLLLAMSFLLLPILPNQPVDPWDAINPLEIWLLAILIAAVSFAGYLAVRILGDRMGIAVAALAGGTASSTATTVSLARLAREQPENVRVLAGGILLAGMTMLAQIILLAGVIRSELLGLVLWPALSAGAILLVTAAWLLGSGSGEAGHPKLAIKNPFDLGMVLQLGALIAAIMLCAQRLRAGSAARASTFSRQYPALLMWTR